MDGSRSTAVASIGFSSLLFASFGFGQQPPPSAPPADASGTPAARLGNPYSYLTQPLLKKVVDAHGGEARLEVIEAMDLRMEGLVLDRDELVEVRIRFAQGPGRTFLKDVQADGIRILQGYDGDRYWMTRDGRPVVPLPGPAENALFRQAQRARFLAGILDLARYGPRVEYRGRIDWEGRPLDCFEHPGRRGDAVRDYADPETHLLVLSESPSEKELTLYDDVRDVEGLRLPHRIRIYESGKPRDEMSLRADLKITSCAFAPLSLDTFRLPAGPSPP